MHIYRDIAHLNSVTSGLTFQGHPRSKVTWPIESPHIVSYRCVIQKCHGYGDSDTFANSDLWPLQQSLLHWLTSFLIGFRDSSYVTTMQSFNFLHHHTAEKKWRQTNGQTDTHTHTHTHTQTTTITVVATDHRSGQLINRLHQGISSKTYFLHGKNVANDGRISFGLLYLKFPLCLRCFWFLIIIQKPQTSIIIIILIFPAL